MGSPGIEPRIRDYESPVLTDWTTSPKMCLRVVNPLLSQSRERCNLPLRHTVFEFCKSSDLLKFSHNFVRVLLSQANLFEPYLIIKCMIARKCGQIRTADLLLYGRRSKPLSYTFHYNSVRAFVFIKRFT